MKLIIDISEYDREWIKNTYGIPQDIDVAIARAIINGKELPDHHGRLVDADALEPDADYDDGDYWAYSVAQVCNAPTIVEAEGRE